MSVDKMMLERLDEYQKNINSLEVLVEHFNDQKYIEVETIEVDHQMLENKDEYITLKKKKPLSVSSCKIEVDFLRRALRAYYEDLENCNQYLEQLR